MNTAFVTVLNDGLADNELNYVCLINLVCVLHWSEITTNNNPLQQHAFTFTNRNPRFNSSGKYTVS